MSTDPARWTYRVRAFTAFTGVPGVEPVEQFDIIELYEGEDGAPVAWGNTLGALGDTAEGLRDDLEAMLRAFDLPVLTEDDLPRSTE